MVEEEWEEEVEEWEEEVEELEGEVVVDALEEEEEPQEASAAPTPTLHLPSPSPAGVAVKAKVRTMVWAECSLVHILTNLCTNLYQYSLPEANSTKDKPKFLESIRFTVTNNSLLFVCKGSTPL